MQELHRLPAAIDTLLPGESLNIVDYLISIDKRFRLYLEDDCSLAVYAYRSGSGRVKLWVRPKANPFSTAGAAPNGKVIFSHDHGAGYWMLYLVNTDVPASRPPNGIRRTTLTSVLTSQSSSKPAWVISRRTPRLYRQMISGGGP